MPSARKSSLIYADKVWVSGLISLSLEKCPGFTKGFVVVVRLRGISGCVSYYPVSIDVQGG